MAQLGRFTHTAASSTTGLPASGASVTIYREGATANGTSQGTSPLTVTVYDIGKIKAGDTVFLNTTTGTTYNVNSTSGRTSLVLGGFAGTLDVQGGYRIIPVGSKPTLYTDDQGSVSTSNPLSTSATGLASCFIEFGAYDYIVSGGSLTTTGFQGMVSGSEAPGQIRFADNFAANSSTGGIQEAIDDLPTAGGKVVCSAKTYETSTSLWLHSGVHIEGAGVGKTIIKRTDGSITDADAANSGGVIACGPKGSNGTLFTSGNAGSNISISNLTMDGNQSNQTVTDTTPAPVGLRAVWVTGLYVHNVKVINTLQSAYYTANCADMHFSNFGADTVGQWATVSARNALDLHNNSNSSTNTSQGTFTNFYFKSVGDEAIALSGCQNVSISNGIVDGADFGIEFTSSSTIEVKDCTFSNINFKNLIDFGITFNATVADASNLVFSNMNFDFHTSNHDAGVIYMSTSTANLSDVIFSNITATNIHSNDSATGRHWIDCQAGTAGKTRSRIFFNNLDFRGVSSIKTADNGAVFLGPCSDIHMTQCYFKDIPGSGVAIDDSAADTMNDMTFNDVTIDGANYVGFRLRVNTAAATIKGICYNNCTARNVGKQAGATTDASGWTLDISAAGSINNIYLRGCRSFKTTGTTHLYGIALVRSAGTLGPVFIDDCDFTNTQTAELTTSGTITGLQCSGDATTTQAITAAANTINLPSRIKHGTIYLTADASYSMSSNPTIPDGWFEGQRLFIMNVDAGADIITLHDEATDADCNLLNANSTDWALNPGDNIIYQWSSALGAWVQCGGVNTIA